MNSISELQVVNPVASDYVKLLAPQGHIASEVAIPFQPQVFQKDPVTGRIACTLQKFGDAAFDVGKDMIRSIGMEASHGASNSISTVTATCLPYARKVLITQSEIEASKQSGGAGAVANLVAARSIIPWSQIMTARELMVASYVTTYGNYASGMYATLTGGSEFNSANGAPLDVIKTMFAAMAGQGVPCTDIAMDIQVMLALSIHDDFTKLLKITDGPITQQRLEVFLSGLAGNPVKLHIARSRYLSSGTKTAAWSDYMVGYNSGVPFDGGPQELASMQFPASFRLVTPGDMSFKAIDAPELDHDGAYWYEGQQSLGVTSVMTDSSSKFIGAYLVVDCLA